MTITHDINFWLTVTLVLAIVYVPGGLLALFGGWVIKERQ